MSNAFGLVLDSASVRRAAAEGVSETVIAAVLPLHERSAEQIVAELSALELEGDQAHQAISTRLSARCAGRTQASESFGIAGAATAIGRGHSQ